MENSNIEKITFDLDSSIIDKLYEETPIKDVGSIEDFLKLPVNEKFKKHKEEQNQDLDFNIKFYEKSDLKIKISS